MILLGKAELSLLSDPTVSVHIPHLTGMPRRRVREGTLVGPFEGDEFPLPFRGLGRSGSFDLSCRYAKAEAELRVRLLWLIDSYAPAQYDSRLLLRTHLEPGTGLPPELQEFLAEGASVAVAVFDVLETPIGAMNTDVTFTATRVQHDFTLDLEA